MNIIGNYFRVSLKNNAVYKTNLFFLVLDELVDCAAVFLFWASLYEAGFSVTGWGSHSRLLFIGLSIISRAISNLFVGAGDLQEEILYGTLDLAIVKPAPTWVVVTFARCNFVRFLLSFPIGLVLAASAIDRQEHIPIFIVSLLSCIVASITLELMLSCVFVLSFWLKKVDVVAQLLRMLFSVKRYPVQVYSGFFLRILTMILPVAYVASIPTEWVHTGRGMEKIVYLLLLFLGTILLLRVLWKKGRRIYESAN